MPLSLALRRRVPEAATLRDEANASLKARSVGLSPGRLQLLLAIAGIGCCVAMSMPQVHIVSYSTDLGYGPAVGAEMLSLMLLGGIVPSYAVIVREYLPPREAGARVGLVIASTIIGMALGGWLSGWIFDATGSYMMAFANGIAWNLLNIVIMVALLRRSMRRGPGAAPAGA